MSGSISRTLGISNGQSAKKDKYEEWEKDMLVKAMLKAQNAKIENAVLSEYENNQQPVYYPKTEDFDNPFYRPFGYPQQSLPQAMQNAQRAAENFIGGAKCGINGYGQGISAYNFDELGGAMSGAAHAAGAVASGNNPFSALAQGYESGRNAQRAMRQECHTQYPFTTYGAELAGAISLTALTRGRMPQAYLANPAANFAQNLGLSGIGAFGQSEKPEDFAPNLLANAISAQMGVIGAKQLKAPENIFAEQAIAQATSMGYQDIHNYFKSQKSK